MKSLKRFYEDESGVVVVMIGAIIALLLVFSVMAIDAPQMMLVKTQLQNAADAGALAAIMAIGASGDTSAAAPAAMLAASTNQALIDSGGDNIMDSVIITPADVTFPDANTVRVRTHRTAADGNPFMNYFLGIFDPTRAGEMQAWAAAQFYWACGGTCLKPWSPPDKWCDSAGTGDCENGNGFFEDSLGEFYDPVTTGYTSADIGDQIILVNGDGNDGDFGEFWYYSIDFPPINEGNPEPGGSTYRDWICNCDVPACGCLADQRISVDPGDQLQVEPGKKTGPNQQGGNCLMAMDPDAEWDNATGTVINSRFPISPRIVKIGMFDPSIGLAYDLNGRPYVQVSKVVAVFVEEVHKIGTEVQITGRFMNRVEDNGTPCEDQSTPSFLYSTKLVE